jgi:hypothetical protein
LARRILHTFIVKWGKTSINRSREIAHKFIQKDQIVNQISNHFHLSSEKIVKSRPLHLHKEREMRKKSTKLASKKITKCLNNLCINFAIKGKVRSQLQRRACIQSQNQVRVIVGSVSPKRISVDLVMDKDKKNIQAKMF